MREEFTRRCHVIEESYEFMLAYAAQGLASDAGSQTGGQLRHFLRQAAMALAGLGEFYSTLIEKEKLEPADRYRAFAEVLNRDACDALAAFDLVLAQPGISSQLIDNLNASIHVRALLTDLFLVDEVLKGQAGAAQQASEKVSGL